MTDKKKKMDELTAEELSEVKGGIPYEKPDLISLEAGIMICKTGYKCECGGFDGTCTEIEGAR